MNEAGLVKERFLVSSRRPFPKRFMVYKKTIQLINEDEKYVHLMLALAVLTSGQLFLHKTIKNAFKIYPFLLKMLK